MVRGPILGHPELFFDSQKLRVHGQQISETTLCGALDQRQYFCSNLQNQRHRLKFLDSTGFEYSGTPLLDKLSNN